MICLDSSAWIEHFTAGPKGEQVRKAIKADPDVIVPSICFVEVGNFLIRRIGKDKAYEYMAAMAGYPGIDLDQSLAFEAIGAATAHKLPLADSIIYASAQRAQAKLITLDNDFRSLPGVKVIE